MTTRIQLIDDARTAIGAGPLQSETAPGADSAIRIYERVIKHLLSCYPWSFGKRKRQLVRLADAPAQHWKYRFAKPSDMAGAPRAIYDDGSERATPISEFELLEDAIHANAPALWALYTLKPDPSQWPGNFTEVAVLALAAEYALSVREDSALRDKLRRDVYGAPEQQGEGGLLAQAKAADTQAQPAPRVMRAYNPLIDIRRS